MLEDEDENAQNIASIDSFDSCALCHSRSIWHIPRPHHPITLHRVHVIHLGGDTRHGPREITVCLC
jgi:hypothetical protein